MPKTKTKAQPWCTCLPRVQEQLMEKYDCHIVIENLINLKTGKMRDSPPQIRLEKNDPKSRKRLTTLFCLFCPFCGTKYSKEG